MKRFTLFLTFALCAMLAIVPTSCKKSNSNSSIYTVMFDTNGGSAVEDIQVAKGESIEAPITPTKSGYTFVNWYSDAALSTLFDFDLPITSNTIVFAKWSENGSTGDDGEETPDYGFQIFSKADLISLRETVNGGTRVPLVTLMADIDLSGEEWIAIGNSTTNYYAGEFNGNNHIISNLTISGNRNTYNGLFGYVTSATIYDLTILNPAITIESATIITYNSALAAYASSRIELENCAVKGGQISITASKIIYAGGLTGHCNSNCDITLTKCRNTSKISANPDGSISETSTSSYVGGLIGSIGSGVTSTIAESYNTGIIHGNRYAGGFIGHVAGGSGNSYIRYSHNTADVTTKTTGTSYAGGFHGGSHNSMLHHYNSYNTGYIQAISTNGLSTDAGGLSGVAGGGQTNFNSYFRNITTTGTFQEYARTMEYMKSQAFVDDLNDDAASGETVSTWAYDYNGVNEGYPILTTLSY